MTKEQISQGMQTIYERASADAAFRTSCLDDGNKAFHAVSGLDLPADYKLRFVDGSTADVTIVLPAAAAADGQLSEKELAAVSGGGRLADWIYGCDQTCCASRGAGPTILPTTPTR